MLNRLYIKNYVIIDELNLEFGKQFNVLTGETGAGKSIIVGALSLILGIRADLSVLINKEEKCIVEGVFDIKNNTKILKLLEEKELDADDELIIRREINAKGKSRAFVNDTPVTLAILSDITAELIDLHRQFDNYQIKNNNDFEFEVLDAVAQNMEHLNKYTVAFNDYQKHSKAYEAALKKQQEWQKEADYKQFLFDELEEAGFSENEIEEAEEALKSMENAEQIKQILNAAYFLFEESEPGLNHQLRSTEQELSSITKVFPQADELLKRIESARIELKDIAEECNTLSHQLEFDEEATARLQERVDLGNRLLKKHQVFSTNDLLEIFKQLSQEIGNQNQATEAITAIKNQRDAAFEQVKKSATLLHTNRKKHAIDFENEINHLLHLIGMPNASIKIQIEVQESYHKYGNDQIQFLWDANKSGNFQPVSKTASGGELSRIMLCIKTLTAEAIALPTLIFDEVDSGISGEAARQVGLLLERLGKKHQVFCITHQPQVAARGNNHFFVYKTETDGSVKTFIKLLETKERILSIAQMIGGEHPTEAALNNAKEMILQGYYTN